MAVQVFGLRQLNRAFLASDRHMSGDLKDALAEAAAPVRRDAQALAASEIRNLSEGQPWTKMRVGVSRSVAYVAPVERGIKTRGGQPKRRPNLGTLLMDRAMEPALAKNVDEVERRFEHLIDEAADVWERT